MKRRSILAFVLLAASPLLWAETDDAFPNPEDLLGPSEETIPDEPAEADPTPSEEEPADDGEQSLPTDGEPSEGGDTTTDTDADGSGGAAAETRDLTRDDVDDLFGDAEAGVVEEDPEEAESVDVGEITTNPEPVFRGSVSVDGTVAYGLTDWPAEWTGDAVRARLDGSPYYRMSPSFTLDVRPTSYQRFFMSLATSLSQTSLAFGTLSIGQLFVDYTFRDDYFFRVGKQTLTWGQGQLVGNPGNIVSGVGTGIAIRSFVPLGPNGISSVLYTTPTWISPVVSRKSFALASQFTASFADTTIGTSFHFREPDPLLLTAYAKTVLGGVDIAAEVVTRWPDILSFDYVTNPPTFQAVSNILWESTTKPKVSLIGEYLFNGSTPGAFEHHGGIGVGLSSIPGWTWDLGVSWRHAFHDGSGAVAIGANGPFAPGLEATLGIPIAYGPPGTYYRTRSSDPGGRVLSLVFQVSMSLSF